MEEIIVKLAKRIVEYNPNFQLYYRDKVNSGIISFLNNWKDYDDLPILEKYDVELSSQWMIDSYLLIFGSKLDGYKLNSAMELLNSDHKGNLIIGMNMLYNIEINK